MIAKIGRTLPWLLGFFGLLSTSSNAFAQGNTFNPFGNSGYADYREFGNPMYSNNPALPGQSVINGEPLISRPRANSYQQFTTDLEGNDSSSGPSSRSGPSNLPYYRAYQNLNPQFNRVYRPGDTEADRKFRDRLNRGDAAFAAATSERDAAFVAANAEKDPAKRAKLLLQVERDFRPRSSKGSPSQAAAGSRASTSNPNGSTPSSATRAPALPGYRSATDPTGRRAPAPFPSTNARRPSSTGPAARAPSITRPRATDSGTAAPRGVNRPAPDPSTIPVPPPQ